MTTPAYSRRSPLGLAWRCFLAGWLLAGLVEWLTTGHFLLGLLVTTGVLLAGTLTIAWLSDRQIAGEQTVWHQRGYDDGYEAGTAMSHSLGCDALAAEREDLRRRLRATSDEHNDVLNQMAELHRPRVEPGDITRCVTCIAGWNPDTASLVYAAWPCETKRALHGAKEMTRP